MNAACDDISHSGPWLVDDDVERVVAALRSGMLANGRLVSEFELAVATYNGCAGGVVVASGTAALALALKALGVKPGSEVILPTYVCRSVLRAVRLLDAYPVLCDVDPDSWNMSPGTVAPCVSSRTAAIIVVHIFGNPVRADGFRQFGVPIVEDCAQAFGAEIDGNNVGAIGDAGMYSFHATKCLTTGEGGMVVARDERVLRRARALYADEPERWGVLSDYSAALGLAQLERYPRFLERRREIATRYAQELVGLPVRLPDNSGSMFFRYPIRVEREFDGLRQRFATHGVQVRRGVDELLHRSLGMTRADFPNAEHEYARTLSLPIYPALTDKDVRRVVLACHGVLEGHEHSD